MDIRGCMHAYCTTVKAAKYYNHSLSQSQWGKSLPQSEDIERKYEELLKLALSLDHCFVEKSGGWGGLELLPEKKEEYRKIRRLVESEISKWMADIRQAINALPPSVKRSATEQHTDYQTSDVYSTVRYDNKNYGTIMGFLDEIANTVEGSQGVLYSLSRSREISEKLRGIRGAVLSLCRTLEIFTPEIMVTIDQQVGLVFTLREKGLVEEALMIEELDQIEDNLKKCLNARTALERVVEAFCKENGIDVKKGFYTNLDNAINAGLTEKSQRNAIAGHYSFVSKIIHGELEADTRNTQFGVNGVINILQSFSR